MLNETQSDEHDCNHDEKDEEHPYTNTQTDTQTLAQRQSSSMLITSYVETTDNNSEAVL
jgi:hypothetical protein